MPTSGVATPWSAGQADNSIKEAAYEAMEDAYLHGERRRRTLPANPRQIMYAARPRDPGRDRQGELDSKYFTQTLLPDFMTDNPELTAEWDIAWDDRGHFREPHTGVQIGLGTLRGAGNISTTSPSRRSARSWSRRRGSGPRGRQGRYGAVLYIEKEGFLPILEAAQIAERYDLALASSKGMSVTACRLAGRGIVRPARPAAVHPARFRRESGFSIKQTLVTTQPPPHVRARHQPCRPRA